MKTKISLLLSILVIFSMMLTACGAPGNRGPRGHGTPG